MDYLDFVRLFLGFWLRQILVEVLDVLLTCLLEVQMIKSSRAEEDTVFLSLLPAAIQSPCVQRSIPTSNRVFTAHQRLFFFSSLGLQEDLPYGMSIWFCKKLVAAWVDAWKDPSISPF